MNLLFVLISKVSRFRIYKNYRIFTSGMHMDIFNILTDFENGLAVNTRLAREGKHVRMVEILVRTPFGDRIAVSEDGVRIINDGTVDEYNFGAAIEVVRNGTLIDFKPDQRNENVFITILRLVSK